MATGDYGRRRFRGACPLLDLDVSPPAIGTGGAILPLRRCGAMVARHDGITFKTRLTRDAKTGVSISDRKVRERSRYEPSERVNAYPKRSMSDERPALIAFFSCVSASNLLYIKWR